MTTTRGNEPAYPMHVGGEVANGMSIREAFAMAAMGGLASQDWASPEHCAKASIRCADALIKRLAETK